jgi:integrase
MREAIVRHVPSPAGELGFKDATFHSFRHFFVSACFLAGMDESDIRDWVGRRDSKIIEAYRHLRPEESRPRMQKLDRLGGRLEADGPSPRSVLPQAETQSEEEPPPAAPQA